MTCKCIYLVVSIEINTCKKHFVFSGLEEDPVEFGFVVFKAFGVEFGVEHSKRLGSVSLSYKDTFITETVPLWCSVQLRLGSVPTVGKPSSLRRNPAAFGCWGLQQPPRICSSVGVQDVYWEQPGLDLVSAFLQERRGTVQAVLLAAQRKNQEPDVAVFM